MTGSQPHPRTFLELYLPDVSGYELAHSLRTKLARLFIVALTGWAHEEDNTVAAGFDHHVLKPLALQELTAIISIAERQLASRNALTHGLKELLPRS